MSEHTEVQLRPGFLVNVRTQIRGGVKYDREDIADDTDGVEQTSIWKTERRIADLPEYERACKARDTARSLLKGACYWTPFGGICPADMIANYFELTVVAEIPVDDDDWSRCVTHLKRADDDGWVVETPEGPEAVSLAWADSQLGSPGDLKVESGATLRFTVTGLDTGLPDFNPPRFTAVLEDVSLTARIQQAEDVVDAFNATAQHSTVRVLTLRGEIAKDEETAIAAVTTEIKDLLGDMDQAIADGDVAGIRDLAGRARTMGKLLDQKATAKTDLERAVKAARKIASAVARRVGKDGEDLADVLQDAKRNPIAVARFAFGDEDVVPPVAPGEGPEAGGMPAVALGRFAQLGPIPDLDTPGGATEVSPGRLLGLLDDDEYDPGRTQGRTDHDASASAEAQGDP